MFSAPSKPKQPPKTSKGGVAVNRIITSEEQQNNAILNALRAQIASREATIKAEQDLINEQLAERRASVDQTRQQFDGCNEMLFKSEQSILRLKKDKRRVKDTAEASLSNYLDAQVQAVLQEVNLEYRKQLAHGEQKLSADTLAIDNRNLGEKQEKLHSAQDHFKSRKLHLKLERDKVAAKTELARRSCLRLIASCEHATRSVKHKLCKSLSKFSTLHGYHSRSLSSTIGHLKMRVSKARIATDSFVTRSMSELARREEVAAAERTEYWNRRTDTRDKASAMEDVLRLMEGDAFFAPDSNDLNGRDVTLIEYRRQQRDSRVLQMHSAHGAGKNRHKNNEGKDEKSKARPGAAKKISAPIAPIHASSLQDGMLARVVRDAMKALAAAEARQEMLQTTLALGSAHTQRQATLLLFTCQELYFSGLASAFDDSSRMGAPSISGGKIDRPPRLIKLAAVGGSNATYSSEMCAKMPIDPEVASQYESCSRSYASTLHKECMAAEHAIDGCLFDLNQFFVGPLTTQPSISNQAERIESNEQRLVDHPAPASILWPEMQELSNQNVHSSIPQRHVLFRQLAAVLQSGGVSKTPVWGSLRPGRKKRKARKADVNRPGSSKKVPFIQEARIASATAMESPSQNCHLVLDLMCCSDLFDTGTVFDKQDPSLRVYLGEKLVGTTRRIKDAGTSAEWPERLEVAVRRQDFASDVQLRVEVLNDHFSGLQAMHIHVGEGSVGLSQLWVRAGMEADAVPQDIRVTIDLTHLPTGTKKGVVELTARIVVPKDFKSIEPAISSRPSLSRTATLVSTAPISRTSVEVTPGYANDFHSETDSPAGAIKTPQSPSERSTVVPSILSPPSLPPFFKLPTGRIALIRHHKRLEDVDDEDDCENYGYDYDDDDEDEDEGDDDDNDILSGDDLNEESPADLQSPYSNVPMIIAEKVKAGLSVRGALGWRTQELDFAIAKLFSVAPIGLSLEALNLRIASSASSHSKRTDGLGGASLEGLAAI